MQRRSASSPRPTKDATTVVILKGGGVKGVFKFIDQTGILPLSLFPQSTLTSFLVIATIEKKIAFAVLVSLLTTERKRRFSLLHIGLMFDSERNENRLLTKKPVLNELGNTFL